MAIHPQEWLKVSVARASIARPAISTSIRCGRWSAPSITHGHADHARPGHRRVLATAETLAIMRARYGAEAATRTQALAYGESVTRRRGRRCGSRRPAMCSAAPRSCWSTAAAASSCPATTSAGRDPTCAPFEPVPCDVFVTEATFGLPVFRHPPDAERDRPAAATRCGCFPSAASRRRLCARQVPAGDRAAARAPATSAPIYLHGALQRAVRALRAHGRRARRRCGRRRPARPSELAGQIVLAPPSAIADRWARRLPDPVVGHRQRLDARARPRAASAASSCRW